MLILITNDDGINAPGIKALARSLARVGRIAVVAPEKERSAIGHGITMHKPLRAIEVPWEGPVEMALAVNGTPADCVKLALDALLDEQPALVVSGINLGANLGTDILYSGTVSGALEGCINGRPSLAVSLAGEGEVDYSFAADFTSHLAEVIIKRGLPTGTLLNLNIPCLPPGEIKGLAITRLGRRRYCNTITRRLDPRGRAYYWLAGEVEDLDQEPDTDIGALGQGRISITPLQLDLTNYSYQQELAAYLPFLWPGQGNR